MRLLEIRVLLLHVLQRGFDAGFCRTEFGDVFLKSAVLIRTLSQLRFGGLAFLFDGLDLALDPILLRLQPIEFRKS